MGVAILYPAVWGDARRVVGVRAEPSQPAALPAEGPPRQVGAVRKQEGRAWERNTAAR